MSGSVENSLLLSMINRVSEKLPTNSGTSIAFFESDVLVLQSVGSLVELSKHKLREIVYGLLSLLDDTCKSSTSTIENSTSNDLLNDRHFQSQHLLLKIISDCLTFYWKSVSSERNPLKYYIFNARAVLSSGTSAASHANVAPNQATAQDIQDPPPLEDGLAKLLIHMISRFFITSSSFVNPDTLTHSVSESLVPAGQYSDIISDTQRIAGQILFYVSGSNWPVVLQRIKMRLNLLSSPTSSALSSAAADMADLDFWDGRDNAGTQPSHARSTGLDGLNGDLTEIRMIENLNLNRSRLFQLLTEIGANIRTCKRAAQSLSAVTLRKAIWNWIDMYPTQFTALCLSQKRLEGPTDALFEFFSSMTDSTRRKQLFWPLQTLLLVCCQDLMHEIVFNERQMSANAQRKAAFLSELRKSLRIAKLTDAAVLCLLDLAKAASCLSFDGASLKSYALSIETELRDRIYDMSRIPPSLSVKVTDNDNFTDPKLLIEFFSVYWKLNRKSLLRNLVPMFLDENANVVCQNAFARACLQLAQVSNLADINASLASALRQLFLDNRDRLLTDNAAVKRYTGHSTTTSTGSTVQGMIRDKASKLKSMGSFNANSQQGPAVDEVSERYEVILSILEIWRKVPNALLDKSDLNVPPSGPVTHSPSASPTIISMDEFRTVLNGVQACLFESSTSIRSAASKLLKKLMDPAQVAIWQPLSNIFQSGDDNKSQSVDRYEIEEMFRVYWKVTTNSLWLIGKNLIDVDLYPQSFGGGPTANTSFFTGSFSSATYNVSAGTGVNPAGSYVHFSKQVLEVIRSILNIRNQYLASVLSGDSENLSNANTLFDTTSPERLQTGIILEMLILVYLSYSDNELCQLVAQCITEALKESQVLGELTVPLSSVSSSSSNNLLNSLPAKHPTKETAGSQQGLIQNAKAYVGVREILLNTGMSVGQKALQKKLRKVLRSMTPCTPGIIYAWEETYKRWNRMNERGGVGALSSNSGMMNVGTSNPTTAGMDSVNIYGATSTAISSELPATKKKYTSNVSSSSIGSTGPSSVTNTIAAIPSSGGTLAFSAGNALGGGSSTMDVWDNNPELKTEWQNCAGLLCSYGGCILEASKNIKGNIHGTASGSGKPGLKHSFSISTALSAINPDTNINMVDTLLAKSRPVVEQFVSDLVQLLECDVVWVREYVKELLASDLSPALYPQLFKRLQQRVNRLFEGDTCFGVALGEPVTNEGHATSLENIVSVVKAIVDRAHECAEYLAKIDIGFLILMFIRYANRLHYSNSMEGLSSSGSNPSTSDLASIAIRIRIKLAQLIESIASKMDVIEVQQELIIRNRLLEALCEWTSFFTSEIPVVPHNFTKPKSSVSDHLYSQETVAASKGDFQNMVVTVGFGLGLGFGFGMPTTTPSFTTSDRGSLLMSAGSDNNVALLGTGASGGPGNNTMVVIMAGKTSKMIRDLNFAVLKAATNITNGMKVVRVSTDVPHSPNEHSKSAHTKSGVNDGRVSIEYDQFKKLFMFFVKVLRMCSIMDTSINQMSESTANIPSQYNAQQQQTNREALGYVSLIRELIIPIITNLLISNIDFGLRYALRMGYSEDLSIRTAFMTVLKNTLTNWCRPGEKSDYLESTTNTDQRLSKTSANLDAQKSDKQKAVDEMLDLLTAGPHFELIHALADVIPGSQIDEFSQTVFEIFESRGLTILLLKSLIEREVFKTDSAATLFRRNSVATKMLSMFGKVHGSQYLKFTLQPLIADLINRADQGGVHFEVDPAKLAGSGSNENLGESDGKATAAPNQKMSNAQIAAHRNMAHLERVCQQFIDTISDSALKMPPPLKDICSHISQTVLNSKYPEAHLVAVGGFIFLRFINPAIVASDHFEIISQPVQSKELRRGLILITKVIQSLANNVLFGSKEAYMTAFNDFVLDNMSKVTKFLKDISSVSSEGESDCNELKPMVSVGDMAAKRAHYYLAQHFAQIQSMYPVTTSTLLHPLNTTYLSEERCQVSSTVESADKFPCAVESIASTQHKTSGSHGDPVNASALSKLNEILAVLGPPIHAVTKARRTSTNPGFSGLTGDPARANQALYKEFMRRVGTELEAGGVQLLMTMMDSYAICYDGGHSRERRPLLCFVAQQLVPSSMRMDLIIYHILTLVEGISVRPFDVFVDLTGFSSLNEIGMDHLSLLDTLLPTNAKKNLHTLILYNASTAFRDFTKRIGPNVFHSKYARRTAILASLSELNDYVSIGEIRLPRTTLMLDKDVTARFSNIMRYTYPSHMIPTDKNSQLQRPQATEQSVQQTGVSLRICQDTIVLSTSKKFELLGQAATLVDLIKCTDLDDVGTAFQDPDDFYFRLGQGKSTVWFSTPQRDVVLHVLQAVRKTYQFQWGEAAGQSVPDKLARISDVSGRLLQLVLFNMGSDDPALRVGAFELFQSLRSSSAHFPAFGLNASDNDYELVSLNGFSPAVSYANGRCAIPLNTTPFVTAISNACASLENPQFALDFLFEFCYGFRHSLNEKMRLHALQYISVWLPSIWPFTKRAYFKTSTSEYSDEIRRNSAIPIDSKDMLSQLHDQSDQILLSLIQLTIDESELLPVVLDKIWSTIAKGRVASIPHAIDSLIQRQMNATSRVGDVLSSIMVTLAAVDRQLVAGRLVSRLRRVLVNTAPVPTHSLVHHPSWSEIAALVKFISSISFNDLVDVHNFIPDLFFACSILAGIGSLTERHAIHGVVVNATHILCDKLLNADGETRDQLKVHEKVRALKSILNDYFEPKFSLLFGLAGGFNSAAPSGGPAATPAMVKTNINSSNHGLTGEDIVINIPLSSVESIVNSMVDVLTLGAESEEIAAEWKARWMGLVVGVSFHYNLAIQPRAFVTLGCVAQSEVDDDLVYQILVALRGTLSIFIDDECRLIVSIIRCLCYIVPNLPTESRYLKTMFWLAISLIQIGHLPVFQSALTLLQVVLRVLDERDCFSKEDVRTYLLKARAPIADVAYQLDAAVGVHFRSHFSFAVAANLMRGLKHPLTKTATTAVLTTLLEISSKRTKQSASANKAANQKVPSDLVGYLIPLLPSAERLNDLLELAGVRFDSSVDQASNDSNNTVSGSSSAGIGNEATGILDKLSLNDETAAVLVLAFLITILENSEYDNREQQFLYRLLGHSIEVLPHAFSIVAPSLIPKLTETLTTNQNHEVTQALIPLLDQIITRNVSVVSTSSYLEESGFAGLSECGSFKTVSKERKLTYAQCACWIVDRLM